MKRVEVPTRIEVSKRPQTAKVAACLIGAVAVLGLSAFGVFCGASFSLFALIPGAWLLWIARLASQSTELRLIQATVEASGNAISVYLPGSRLFDGRYVDQEYTCALGDVESFGFDDAGVFSLRARRLLSDAYENGHQVDHREHEFMEVSFKVVSDEDMSRLQEFVQEL